MPGPEAIALRPAGPEDGPALAEMYGHHVLHGFGTFETEPPSAEEMGGRRRVIMDQGLPYLVATVDEVVVGFAYAAPFRPRAAYRYTVEDSIYIAPEMAGRGVGRLLLGAVIQACEDLGKRQMIAVIGDSDNLASIGLHAALGFSHAGVGRSLGFKQGRWLDVVWMQRGLSAREDDAHTG